MEFFRISWNKKKVAASGANTDSDSEGKQYDTLIRQGERGFVK